MNIKKLLIFGGVGLIVIAGVAVAADYLWLHKFFGGGDKVANQDTSPEQLLATTTAESAPLVSPSQPFANLDEYADEDESQLVAVNQTHIINVPPGPVTGARGGFLKCQLSIIVRDPELGKEMASTSPTYQNVTARALILETLTTLEAEELLSYETRTAFAHDVLERLNEQFRPKPSAVAATRNDKNAPPPRPNRPIKDVMVIEWAIQPR